MNSSNLRRAALQGAALSTLTTILLLSIGTSAAAQDQGAERQDEVGDVVIVTTARRQAEDIQDVPLTVTALSGDDLKQQNITKPIDLQFAAPSVTVQDRLGRLGGGYTIRGLNAGVVTYFNESPSGPTSIGMPFFDVASVEILNGPQGTLFGRTAAAGAVLITPRHPDLSEFGGYVDYATGNYGRQQATGALNVPIIQDELAVRLVYNHDHIDGFTEAVAPPEILPGLPGPVAVGQKLDERNSNSIRAAVEWKRGAFSNYAVFSHLKVDQAGPGHVMAYSNPGLANLNRSAAVFSPVCTAAVGNGLYPNVGACTSERVAISAQIRANLMAEDARIQAGGDDAIRQVLAYQGLTSTDQYLHNGVIDVAEYDFGDLGFTTLQLKNIFSWERDAAVTLYGLDGAGGVTLAVTARTAGIGRGQIQQVGNAADLSLGKGSPNVYIEEFQFSGVAASAINWQAGVFYQKTKSAPYLEGVRVISRSFSGLFTQNLGWTANSGFEGGSNSMQIAGYGQATVDLDAMLGVPGLKVTGGYRHTHSEANELTYNPIANPAGTGPFLPSTTLSGNSSSDNGSNYTVSVSEELTPDLLLYVTHSKSFTPGGVNGVFIGCNVAPSCSPTYDPETARSYEAGVKSEFHLGDARVRLNADIYRIDFTDIQQTFRYSDGNVNLIYQVNIAGARMQGVEAHAGFLMPNWELSMNYSYLNAQYTDWIGPDPHSQRLSTDVCLPGSAGSVCLLDFSDEPFVNAPAHQLNGTLRVDLPIEESLGDAWISVNGYYQTRQYHITAAFREMEIAQAVLGRDVREGVSQAPYGLINLRAQWNNIGGSNWTAALFVNNLTDKVFSQSGGNRAWTTGASVKLYGPPRMWGANIVYNF